jgi:nodulation protein E
MGAISPLGMSLEESWMAARNGQSAIKVTSIDAGEFGPAPFNVPVALAPEDPLAALEAKLGRRIGNSLDLFSIFALHAAADALADAGLSKDHLDKAGIVFGHGMGGIHTLETGFERFYGKKNARLHPLTVPKVMHSAPVSAIAIEFGIRGPVFAVASACASSGHSIAQGAMLLRAGLADVVIVGGSEAIASPGCLAAWEGIRAMSPTTCRPFSAGRDGMNIGEGAAAMVLETAAHAKKRGAKVIATLAGVGMSSDANHWTQPSLDGAVGCMRAACEEAGILNDGPVLISTHGTGTPLNDKNETEAIKVVFGDRYMDHPVIATKSAHGHLIGAATALQAVLGICAMRDGIAPPILNYLGPDPECALNLVLGEAQPMDCKSLLVNAFAFGGLNASIVFRLADSGA